MKKTFFLICVLFLQIGMVTHAHVKVTPKQHVNTASLLSTIDPTTSSVTNQHRAPMDVTYDCVVNFSWNDYTGLFCNQSGTYYRYAGYQWVQSGEFKFELMSVYLKSTQVSFKSPSGSNLVFPAYGTLPVYQGTRTSTSYIPGGSSGVCTQAYANGQCKTSYKSDLYLDGSLVGGDAGYWYYWDITGGNVYFQAGANSRPYAECDLVSGNLKFFITIGSLFGFDLQATNGQIDMVDNDDNAHYSSNGQHYGFTAGTSATLTATPANSGYVFDHWEYNGVNYGNTNPLNWTVASGDDTYHSNTDGYIHLTAVFVPAPVDVTLAPNGGSGSNQVVSATNGSAMPITLKAGGSIVAPTRLGYTFDGYVANNDGTGTKYYNANLTSANNWDKTTATTIYAKWNTITYNIIYHQNDGSGATNSTYTIESSLITLPTAATMTKEGFTFDGWYANSDLTTGGVVTTIPAGSTGDKTFWAKWTPKTYAITLDANTSNHGDGSNTTATAVYDSIALRTFAATAAEAGYHVEGYYTAATSGTKVLKANGTFAGTNVTGYITSNKWSRTTTPTTLHAHMVGNSYSVRFNKNNASATGTMEDQAFVYGTEQELTANDFELANHNFAGWATSPSGDVVYADGATVNELTTVQDDVVELYAVWSVSSHTVSLTKNYTDYGTLTDSEDNVITEVTDVEHNADINIDGSTLTIGSTVIIATPATDADGLFTYNFDNWTDGEGNALPANVSDNMTIRANFDRDLKSAITLRDTENDAYYDKVKAYNDETVDVTYERTTAAGTWGTNWSTLCLPFDVDEDNMNNGLNGRVYQFNYAVGNAAAGGDGLELHFGKAETMVAGKGYLVKDRNNPIRPIDGTLDFYEVTINTTADNSEDVTDLVGYNNGEGVIKLVGTLRKFILPERDHQYMGLKNNMIYYPGANTTVPAYRAFFKIDSPTPVAPRVRIVVEDEQATPIEVIEMDGEGNLMPVSGEEVRKYIEDGVLIIERNGKKYTAQGAPL